MLVRTSAFSGFIQARMLPYDEIFGIDLGQQPARLEVAS